MNTYLELEQVQEISQKMLDLAQANDWEPLPDLELKRKNLMHSFFEQQQISAQDSAPIEQLIQRVLSINDMISQLAEQKKVSIGQQLNGLKKRQNVHSAYLQNK